MGVLAVISLDGPNWALLSSGWVSSPARQRNPLKQVASKGYEFGQDARVSIYLQMSYFAELRTAFELPNCNRCRRMLFAVAAFVGMSSCAGCAFYLGLCKL